MTANRGVPANTGSAEKWPLKWHVAVFVTDQMPFSPR